VDFHQCQFQAPWRKATKVVAWFSPSLQLLSRRCVGRRGICSASGRHHIVLSGAGPDGRKYTSIAAAYPTRLAQALGRTVIFAIEAAKQSRLASLAAGL
jgi:hypothetical protein